jgi:hypothetical protein
MLKEYLSGGGEASSKRLFLLVLICLYAIYFLANLFFGFVLKPSIEDAHFYLIIYFFIGVGLEKWPLNISALFQKMIPKA